ncbi:MAG: hypothetical protein JWM88_962 [Verrucomicrobia bacterium]|nr:hypothetical protein [Verrucomicrobiota bacterium]
MKSTVTLKELHAQTGLIVRHASKSPLRVTDRGRLIAVLAHPDLLPARRRHRTLLPEYSRLLAGTMMNDVLEDLNAVRGER